MTQALLDQLQGMSPADVASVRQIAVAALATIAPTFDSMDVARRADVVYRLKELTEQANADAQALKHLHEEGLVDRMEDAFAVLEPSLETALTPAITTAISLLSALAGPFSGALNFGLLVAVKVMLFALQAWAKKRTLNIPQQGRV